MKKMLLLTFAALAACQSEPTLQKYFVAQTDNQDFVTLDVSPSILNLDQTKLSLEQKQAFQSFDRMNILAFKATDANTAEFETERAKVSQILKDPKYQQLMKFGSGKEGASISFVGDDEHIDEFVVFANKKENGFAVVRVLGNDMNPTSIVTMVSALQNADIDLKQLEPLQQLLEK
ncbi:DUF4252 domain-containing protein [Flavobacterium caeni]|uniref:DUF4252 domain-containing protein n=1 Tax=Flavobacterium caeni TaxID=490189 RepID=A0A1G5HSQ8_9FLAO|nr:DUF4252 domain-containing protein [Flavobacterium caeni]SCY66320.1 protein of unknown function [Flavobacterium caeni]